MSGTEQTAAPERKNVAGEQGAAFVIVVGLSAGGLVPIRRLLALLPSNLPAAIVVAQHARGITYLPAILAPTTPLRVKVAEAGDVLRCGTVYVGPAGQHVIVTADGCIQLANRSHLSHCPSADWLFESAAGSFGECVIAVVLSGRLSDGARGVVRVKRAGGHVFVQEPQTCSYPAMPVAAIHSGVVDAALSPDDLAPALLRVLGRSVIGRGADRRHEPFATERAGSRLPKAVV